MTAEVLREAAASMRTRAMRTDRYAPSPWSTCEATNGDPANGPTEVRVVAATGQAVTSHGYDTVGGADAEHIAGMHPAVALAVADWLDNEADEWARTYVATQKPSPGVDVPAGIHHGNPAAAATNADHHHAHALAVARAYLEGDA